MSEFLENFLHDILLTTIWEWLTVIFGAAYVILAMLQKNICWIFAIISSSIYVYLCISGSLYIESTLQVFYIVIAIIGWITWSNMKKQPDITKLLDQTPTDKGNIRMLSLKLHGLNIVLSGVVAFLLGLSFDLWTDQANPYMDAFITIYSLVATYMVVKKVLGSWIYWILIDLVSIVLYTERDYSLTAVLYAAFTLIAIIGFFTWRKAYKNQST